MNKFKCCCDNFDEDKLQKFLRSIPVAINNLYGDPFVPAQIEDTFYKLSELKKVRHKAPISIITKFNFNDSIIERLSEYRNMKNLIFFYSLTGFDEGGVPFQQRVKAFKRLAEIMPNVVLLFRPIIVGRNDNPEIVKQMIDICKETTTSMVYTSLYTKEDGKAKKNLATGVEKLIIKKAAEKGIKVFPKSACAAKYVLDLDICYAHVKQKPQNLDILRLFYTFKMENDVVSLHSGTHGDYNFVRFITHSNPEIINEKKERFLSFTSFPVLISSSWFSWAKITPCEINCDYCLIDIYPESIEYKKIGCDPVYMSKLITKNRRSL